MKVYRDNDPVMGRVHYFREGLSCSTCRAPLGQQGALIREAEKNHLDQKLPPKWDLVHKTGVGGTDGCDDGSGVWTELDLAPPMLISLHDRALRCLVSNGVMSNEERLRQISIFAELIYEAADRGFSTPKVMTAAEIQAQVDEDELVPVAPSDPI